MDNVISLKAYKVEKEVVSLFSSYLKRISNMSKQEFLYEIGKVKEEYSRYPNHLLTLVKTKYVISVGAKNGFIDIEFKNLLSEVEKKIAKRKQNENY